MTDINCLILRPFDESKRPARRALPPHVLDAPLRLRGLIDDDSPNAKTDPKTDPTAHRTGENRGVNFGADDTATPDELDATAPSPARRRRGVWALADQGVVSLGNCATNVLLVRGLAPAQYGSLAIVLESMLFLNTLQAALVTYPLSVRGSVLDQHGLRRLAGACLFLTFILAFPLGAGVFAAAGTLSAPVAGILATLALVLWQCQETLRRAMMAHGGHHRALPADLVSYFGQAIAMLVMVRTNTLTIDRAFAVMGLTSALAVAIQVFQIGPIFESLRSMRETALDFWKLGRWVMFGGFTAVITTLSCSWTLAYFHGTGQVAQFQAIAGLLKFSNPLTICMAGLIVPAAARAFRTRGLAASRRIAAHYGLLTAVVLAPYYGFLILFPSTAIHLLYGKATPYGSLANPLRAFVMWYAMVLVAQIASCYLNAIEQSRRGFVAQLAQACAVVLITLPLTAIYGLNGLMIGGVIGNVVLAGCTLLMARRIDEPQVVAHRRFVEDEMQASASIPLRPRLAA